MKVSRVSEMRDLDRTAVEEFLIAEEILMENAGLATCRVISQEFGIQGKRFLVFCGLGNNGGDGFVIAREIHSCGGVVKVFILGNPEKFKGPARMNLDILLRLPVEVNGLQSAESVSKDVQHADAVVDAIFGTGLARDVGGLYAEVIDLINKCGRTIFSADIPSGVNGDTGQVMGTAIRANYTVTYGLPKIGNILFPGYELCGKLYVTHISFPPSMYEKESIKVEINQPPLLPPRARDAHKGDFGQALFIAGASSYFGAPYFAALSFLKAGGGYSRLAAPRSITPFIANKGSEIVFVPQKETSSGSLSLENFESLLTLADKMGVVILGPGLSLEKESQELAIKLAREIDKPLIIDGDGITAVCKDLEVIKAREAQTVLTPHMGEMSRITARATSDIDRDKVATLQDTARELGVIIVLKGAHSLIGYPDERVFINMTGNAGMATAGSGDVLTGTIAAMLGLGLPLDDAVRKGIFIHGLSGDLAARDLGEDGITAQDILDYLPLAMKADREDLDTSLADRYLGPRAV